MSSCGAAQEQVRGEIIWQQPLGGCCLQKFCFPQKKDQPKLKQKSVWICTFCHLPRHLRWTQTNPLASSWWTTVSDVSASKQRTCSGPSPRRRVPVQCERTHQQSFSKPNQVLVTKPHVRKHAQRCYRVPSASAKQPVSVSAGPFMERQYRVKLRLNHNFSWWLSDSYSVLNSQML